MRVLPMWKRKSVLTIWQGLPLMIALLLGLWGCASVIEGTSQSISVDTVPAGASCKFVRENVVIGAINSTPGGVYIDKTKHDITVTCKKDGYETVSGTLESGIESATFGNIIGGVGWAIDSASGADNHYPDTIALTLKPKYVASQGIAGRWMGRGHQDGCGEPWAIELVIKEQFAHGILWRAGVEYEISHRIDGSGRMENVLAGRTRESQGKLGPRLLLVNLYFETAIADGNFAIEDRGQCYTPVTLVQQGS
ncbi:MAG: hypothetical protein V3V17_12325 [Alphaproteobacteria bacterium]